MSVTLGELLSGVLLAAVVAIACATGAGHLWRRLPRRPDGLVEPALALFGLVATASALTLVLLLAWGVPFSSVRDAPSLGHPAFVASLLGTVGGHLAVLAWARSLGAPVALRRASPRWMLVGVGVGMGALLFSAAWTETARLFGRPMADQALVETVLDAGPGGPRVAAVLFVVGVAPVLEELVFRGYLQTAIAARLGPAVGIGVAAALFGLFHLSDPAVVPVLAVVGALLGWVRHRSGSVYPAMAGHLVNNVAAMAIALS